MLVLLLFDTTIVAMYKICENKSDLKLDKNVWKRIVNKMKLNFICYYLVYYIFKDINN
jgi:hypothetical protein